MTNEMRERIKDKVKEVIKLRKIIQQEMMNYGLRTVLCYNSPNPFYNQTTVDSVICAEYYYGTINKLYSPIGYFNITSQFTSWDCNGNRRLFEERIKEMGFTEYKDSIKDFMGTFGPWYTYGNGEVVYNDQMIDYDECKHIYQECITELEEGGFILEVK